jgi:DNA-binding response OmpR family regulator
MKPNSGTNDSLAGTRILIIEDEKDLARTYCDILENAGCFCKSFLFADPPKAKNIIEAIRDFKPQVLTTGLDQPSMSGEEIIEAVRAQISILLPIIVVSANTRVEKLERIFKLGIDYFVTKPVMPEDLLKAVDLTVKKVRLLESYRN